MTRGSRGWSPSGRLPLIVALLAPAAPILVALVARRAPAWVPDLDLALTELRVRDVGGPHTPLIGLPGRIGSLQRQGSHPGPLSFYLLAGPYRLLGSTAFALQAATVVLHLAAIGAAVGLVVRQAGRRWALASGLAVAVLVAGLGPGLFTEPWNPHLPLLWWAAFLVAAWCALSGDVVALPVLVGAGAICAQTHISYVGAVTVLTLVAGVACIGWPRPPGGPARAWWAAGAVALGALVWAPVVVDQVTEDPGNLGLLREHLLESDDDPLGWGDGTGLVLERLDVVHLAEAVVRDPGLLAERYPRGARAWRGGLLLAALAAGVSLSWRRATRRVRAVQVLAALSVLLAVVSVSRIVGHPWSYLMLWVWAVALLAVLAVVASIAVCAPAVARRAVPAALVVALAAVGARAAVPAADAAPTNPVVSRTVSAVLPALLPQLDRDERYLVTWADAVHLGGHGYGLIDELERHGFTVAVPDVLARQFGRHRSVVERPTDLRLVVATGEAIATWVGMPGVELLADVDARTASERRDAVRTRAALLAELRAEGLDDLTSVVDENLLAVAFDERATPDIRALVDRLDVLGARAVVLLAPIGATP